MNAISALPAFALGREQKRGVTILGATLGLVLGWLLTGVGALSLVVYFSAWCGDRLDVLGLWIATVGMVLGLVIGLVIYAAAWMAAGAVVLRFIVGTSARLLGRKSSHVA
jgi:hypothetical protein